MKIQRLKYCADVHNTWTLTFATSKIVRSIGPVRSERPFEALPSTQVKAAQKERDEAERDGKWTRISFARVSAPWLFV